MNVWFSFIHARNWSSAIPSTTIGTMSGDNVRLRMTSRPRKRYRSSAMAADRPRHSDPIVARQASFTLVQREPMNGPLASAALYQRREKPSGGKRSASPAVNEAATMMTAGMQSPTYTIGRTVQPATPSKRSTGSRRTADPSRNEQPRQRSVRTDRDDEREHEQHERHRR